MLIAIKHRLLSIILYFIIFIMFFTGCQGSQGVMKVFGSIENEEIKEVIENKDDIDSKLVEPIKRISIAAVGDNLMHLEVIKDFKTGDSSEYDFAPLYQNIKDIISGADIAFINQETILGGTELGLSGYPLFNSPKELGRDLVNVGFDVVNHANNHALDKGVKGVENTLAFWRSYPQVAVTGIYGSQEDKDKIRIVERNGIKAAFLAYTYGTNGIPVPKDKPYIVSLIDKKLMEEDVRRAQQAADAVIVSMHWGNEYQQDPSKEQRELGQFLADLGVTMVIGHHPHVLQPLEWVRGKEGNLTLVAYSLGNLISAQDEVPRLLGGLLKVNIEKGIGGTVSVKDPQIIPLVTHYERYAKGFRIYTLQQYTSELAARHGLNRKGKPVSVEALNKIAITVLGEYYRQ